MLNAEKDSFERLASSAGISLSENQHYQNLKFFTETEEGKKLYHISRFSPEILYSYSSMIMDKDWILFETDNNNPFIIGDNPAVLHNSSKTFPYLGLGVPEIEMYLPISNKLTLGFWCKSINKKREETYKDTEEKMSFLKQAYYQNYRNLTLEQRLPAEITIKSYEDNKDLHEKENNITISIKKQNPIISEPDKVRFFNERQAIFSEKFVYSNRDDFTVVKELIAINPAHKKGWNIKTK